MGCDTEARITAVERAQEYADLTPEAPAIVDDYRPPKVGYCRPRPFPPPPPARGLYKPWPSFFEKKNIFSTSKALPDPNPIL